MRKSVLTKEQQKQWMRAYTAFINGNPAWKKDFEEWASKYEDLMKEKLEILAKYSKDFRKFSGKETYIKNIK